TDARHGDRVEPMVALPSSLDLEGVCLDHDRRVAAAAHVARRHEVVRGFGRRDRTPGERERPIAKQRYSNPALAGWCATRLVEIRPHPAAQPDVHAAEAEPQWPIVFRGEADDRVARAR